MCPEQDSKKINQIGLVVLDFCFLIVVVYNNKYIANQWNNKSWTSKIKQINKFTSRSLFLSILKDVAPHVYVLKLSPMHRDRQFRSIYHLHVDELRCSAEFPNFVGSDSLPDFRSLHCLWIYFLVVLICVDDYKKQSPRADKTFSTKTWSVFLECSWYGFF